MPRFAGSVYGRKSLSVAMVVVCLISLISHGSAYAQDGQSEVARYLIKAGTAQYKQGNYDDAEKILLQAQGYQQYLPTGERKKLDTLLNDAHQAAMNRKAALQDLNAAKEQFAQNRPEQAMPYLARIKDSEYLTESERAQARDMLGSLPGGETQSSDTSLLHRIAASLPLVGSKNDDPGGAPGRWDPRSPTAGQIRRPERTCRCLAFR